MATKTSLQNAIDTALSIVITKAKVLTGLNNIIDEIYNTTLFLNNQNPLIGFTLLIPDLTYTLQITKRGNNVNLQGFVSNGTGFIISNSDLFQIESSLSYLYPITAAGFNVSPRAIGTDGKHLLISPLNTLRLFSNLGVGEIVYFNLNYTTTA